MTARSTVRRARVLAAASLTALALLAAPAASAHDVLIASDPQDGATLTEAPQAVTLTFNNAPLDVGSAIVVVDADGATVVEGEGTVEGADVTLELGQELGSGSYEARWRVASSDGHPIDGIVGFTVELPASEPPPAEEATTEPTEEPVPVDEPTVAAQPDPVEEAADEPASGLSSLPLWLRVVIALAALASVVGLIIRVVRRQRGDRV